MEFGTEEKAGTLMPNSSQKKTESKRSETQQNPNLYGEMKFFSNSGSKKNPNQQQKQKEKEKQETQKPQNENLQQIPGGQKNNSGFSMGINSNVNEFDKKEYLEEIDPMPFDGSYLTPSYQRKTREQTAFTSQPQPQSKSHPQSQSSDIPSRSPAQQVESKKSQVSPNSEKSETQDKTSPPDISHKRKRLVTDMKDVLSFISEKLPSLESRSYIEPHTQENKGEKPLKLENLNELLRELLNIDMYIEASAIINNKGTIVASAVSDRASDSLFATIAQNLFMIGSDIIEGLNAGNMTSMTLRGTEGILDLAPLYNIPPDLDNYLLIIFSSPRVKSGIIKIAKSFVAKQLKLLCAKNFNKEANKTEN
jgi:predicted regulator of Ras-like GTPase activity (Roadblock/LC7/MglB family)